MLRAYLFVNSSGFCSVEEHMAQSVAQLGFFHSENGTAQHCEGLGFAGSQNAGMLVKLTETSLEKQLPKGELCTA